MYNNPFCLLSYAFASHVCMRGEESREDPETTVRDSADILAKLSRGLKDLETAEKLNAERTENIRKAALVEAAKAVEQSAKSDGLSTQTIEKIKKHILGL